MKERVNSLLTSLIRGHSHWAWTHTSQCSHSVAEQGWRTPYYSIWVMLYQSSKLGHKWSDRTRIAIMLRVLVHCLNCSPPPPPTTPTPLKLCAAMTLSTWVTIWVITSHAVVFYIFAVFKHLLWYFPQLQKDNMSFLSPLHLIFCVLAEQRFLIKSTPPIMHSLDDSLQKVVFNLSELFHFPCRLCI